MPRRSENSSISHVNLLSAHPFDTTSPDGTTIHVSTTTSTSTPRQLQAEVPAKKYAHPGILYSSCNTYCTIADNYLAKQPQEVQQEQLNIAKVGTDWEYRNCTHNNKLVTSSISVHSTNHFLLESLNIYISDYANDVPSGYIATTLPILEKVKRGSSPIDHPGIREQHVRVNDREEMHQKLLEPIQLLCILCLLVKYKEACVPIHSPIPQTSKMPV